MVDNKTTDFDIGTALEAANKIEKEVVEKKRIAETLRRLATTKGISDKLKATSKALEVEIEKKKKVLEYKETQIKDIELAIARENEQLEAKKVESLKRIRDVESSERKRIQDVHNTSRERLEEEEKKTKDTIVACGKTRRDAEHKAQEAVGKKEKAEGEFNAFTNKLVGAIK